jgi:hypothetical protein
MTLVEMLSVIAITAVIATIAIPVFHNIVSTEQTRADVQSAADVADFRYTWTHAGYTVADGTGADAGQIVATDINGLTMATITASGSNGNGGGTGGSTGGGVTIAIDHATGLLSYTVDPTKCVQTNPDVAWGYHGSAGNTGLMATNQSTTLDSTGWPLNLGYGNMIDGYTVQVLCSGQWTTSDNMVAP